MEKANFDILSKNYDLLSQEKQAVARWLCIEWKLGTSAAPKWLQRKYWQLFHFPLRELDAPEKMARELVLELLSAHKQEISVRQRGAG